MKREKKESEDKKYGTGVAEIILVLIVLIILVLAFKPQIQELASAVFEKFYQRVYSL